MLVMARAGVNSASAEPCTLKARESSKVCAGKPSGEFFGIGQRTFDLHRYRMLFPDRWRPASMCPAEIFFRRRRNNTRA
jgi:hypothetical protein